MAGLLDKLLNPLRARRQARAEAAMRDLKVRYHTFRILLDNNERSLELLNSLEAAMRDGEADRDALAAQTDELLAVTYELADGLNRLSDGGHGALYGLHRRLAREIRAALDGLEPSAAQGPAAIFLDDLGPVHAAQAGGKAANLAALRRAGLPVPDGFCIPAHVCRRFLDSAGLTDAVRGILRDVGLDGPKTGGPDADLDRAAERIGELVMAAPLPPDLAAELSEAHARLAGPENAPVSARSSALVEDRPGASFAGQFTSLLNLTSAEALHDAYRAIVAANFAARPLAYRLHLGLPAADFGMAVLCQRMVPARSAGVLFTVDPAEPEGGRMLVSAVPGLGTLAVGGESPADVYRPDRKEPGESLEGMRADIAVKTVRQVMAPGGGLALEDVPESEAGLPVLEGPRVAALARLGLVAESLLGGPQDLEWCLDADGELRVLQSRPLQVPVRAGGPRVARGGELLLEGGVSASPGRAVGRAHIVRDRDDLRGLESRDGGPRVLVMHQSLVDAARWLPGQAGVVVDLGNPADHLSNVAREQGLPMLTGTGRATEVVEQDQWIILDADRVEILAAPEEAWASLASSGRAAARPARAHAAAAPEAGGLPPGLQRLHEATIPLHLTDAYGPTFSMSECKSVHDLVRYTHEMAVLSMFDVGDEIMDEAGMLLRRLILDVPLHFLLIDVGGGVSPESRGRDVRPGDILSRPFQALYRGVATPGLRWNVPAAVANTGGLLSRAMLDGRGARPVGEFNYGLISRDYMNLNARLDFHFVLIDAVCGPNARENAVRFRFKGGGTSAEQRERRARCIAEILRGHDFMTSQSGDLVTASLAGASREDVEQRLEVLGRLLGFSRLLDAAMTDDDMPARLARAFAEGDYALAGLTGDDGERAD